MLVLRRKKGQSILINEAIRIVVVETRDGSCQLGIEAPQSDRIRREELAPFHEQLFQQTALRLKVPQ